MFRRSSTLHAACLAWHDNSLFKIVRSSIKTCKLAKAIVRKPTLQKCHLTSLFTVNIKEEESRRLTDQDTDVHTADKKQSWAFQFQSSRLVLSGFLLLNPTFRPRFSFFSVLFEHIIPGYLLPLSHTVAPFTSRRDEFLLTASSGIVYLMTRIFHLLFLSSLLFFSLLLSFFPYFRAVSIN